MWWSKLVNLSSRRVFAVSRTPSSPRDLRRSGFEVRSRLGCLVFLLAGPLSSADSAGDSASPLFAGLIGTMGPSDFPRAFMSAVPPLEFSDRRRRLPSAGVWGLPVLVFEVSTHAPVLRLRRVRPGLANNVPVDVAFHWLESVGTTEKPAFGAQCPGLGVPLPLPHPRCCHRQRTTRGQRIWLKFRCKTLSFSTSNRFIPAFS